MFPHEKAALKSNFEILQRRVQHFKRQQESLASLAERHRTLARLVDESPALYELAARSDDLLSMLETPPPAAD